MIIETTVYHPLPLKWYLVGRKTSCMACQQKIGVAVIAIMPIKELIKVANWLDFNRYCVCLVDPKVISKETKLYKTEVKRAKHCRAARMKKYIALTIIRHINLSLYFFQLKEAIYDVYLKVEKKTILLRDCFSICLKHTFASRSVARMAPWFNVRKVFLRKSTTHPKSKIHPKLKQPGNVTIIVIIIFRHLE